LRVAFAGTPEFALPAFHALARSRHQLVGVLTQPDRPKGRGRQVAASPVKLAAVERRIPVSQPVTLKNEADRADLTAWQPDVLVVVAYGLILPRAVLELPRLGCVNIHASLLPRWRGAAPIQRAILAGDPQTGVSIMRMDVGLDTGAVFLERVLPIGPEENAGSLHDRLAAEGGEALLQVLDELAADTAKSTPQREDGVTYAAKVEKSEALIDWARDAEEIGRKVRAFNPWPIAETRMDGEQLRIYGARVLPGSRQAGESVAKAGVLDAAAGHPDGSFTPGAPSGSASRAADPCSNATKSRVSATIPGTITAVRDDSIIVACGRGSLALTELQRPGRRPVAARDLINTLDLVGRRLG
jgi:methionyl-tRNA formyltransferase